MVLICDVAALAVSLRWILDRVRPSQPPSVRSIVSSLLRAVSSPSLARPAWAVPARVAREALTPTEVSDFGSCPDASGRDVVADQVFAAFGPEPSRHEPSFSQTYEFDPHHRLESVANVHIITDLHVRPGS